MAIQKHNTYYDTTKPNSGIYCYDENGNHKEVLSKNDLNAISSISSINDKVTTLSSKTVSEIKSTDTVTATPHTAPDGTIYYELEAAPEVSDTVINGENGISATNQGTKWTIGLSADYLSANALNNLSGNWQNTFTAVTANSSVWDTVKDRVYSADFIPVKNDVDVLKANSAHYPVESSNDFITVGSANNKFTLTFNSGDLVTSGWVEERLKDFGGFTTANPGISGEPAVDEPSTKLIYLVPDVSATGKDKYSEWIYGTNSAWICIGETSVDLEPLYELSGKFIDHSVNKKLHIQDGERTKWNEVSAKLNKDDFNSWSAKTVSWDITEYSGGFGIDITDHTISLTENYLSANALDNLSGKWEKASDTLIASSGKWNDTYETVSANSARWDKIDEKLDTSVFEAYTATADDIQYSGKNGIAIENHEVWISADYLSANALKDLSGKWENASDVVIADSAKWNSAYSAIASANLWNGTYERVQASADEWDKVVNKLDKSESAKYMLVDKIDKTTDDKISGYNGSELYYPPVKEYSGKNGIKVEDYFIGIDSGWLDERYQEKGDYLSASEKFLSANALNNLSGNWESTYQTVSTNSATWEKVKDLHNVEISSTNGSIGVTATTAEDGTVKYDLSVDEVAVPDISGENGVSARYDEAANGYIVGLEHSSLTYFEGKKTIVSRDTLTDGIIPFEASDCTLENVTLENGVITIPNNVEKVTFSINETVEGNTTYTSGVADHTYQLNKISLYCGGSELLTTQDYYPNEVGFNELTLTYTLDNSKRVSNEYSIRYEGTPITGDGELRVTVSIIEEVQSLNESSGEGGVRYTGRTGNPVIVDNNTNEIYLDGDVDNYTVKTTSTDSNPNYLSNKIIGDGEFVDTSVENNQVKVSLKPSTTNGQVIKTVDGQAQWETLPELSGEAPIWVNNNTVGLNYDPDQFAVSGDGLHSTLQIKIITSGGIIDQEAFEKLADVINGRMTETIPFGALNQVASLAGYKQYAYLFRPTIEYEMTQNTVAYMFGGNYDAGERVAVAVYDSTKTSDNLIWRSDYPELNVGSGGEHIMQAHNSSPTGTIYPDHLYYVAVRIDKNGGGGSWNNVLGVPITNTTDVGNLRVWLGYGFTGGEDLNFPNSINFNTQGSLGSFGGLKPYVGFRTNVPNV